VLGPDCFPGELTGLITSARASVFAGVFKGSTVQKTESIVAAAASMRPSIVNFVQGYSKV
jgi:hypothetical protein